MKYSSCIAIALASIACIPASLQAPATLTPEVVHQVRQMEEAQDPYESLHKRSPRGRSTAGGVIHGDVIEEKVNKYKKLYQEAPDGSEAQEKAEMLHRVWNSRLFGVKDVLKAKAIAAQFHLNKKAEKATVWAAHAKNLEKAKQ